jgi:hypothetical protein
MEKGFDHFIRTVNGNCHEKNMAMVKADFLLFIFPAVFLYPSFAMGESAYYHYPTG